jgi:Transglycosylase SLT domain
MRRFVQFVLLGLLVTSPLRAAELANLRNGFSIRDQRHEASGDTTRLYMSDAPDSGYIDVPSVEIVGFEPAPPEPQEVIAQPQDVRDLNSIISSASTRNQVDADFIASVIRAESANNPRAVSPKGAQGLMQLMPQTASKLGVKNSFDSAQNVDGGVRYLRDLLLLYDNDMIKALAAYNAGPQRVRQYKGLPPYRETHAYVARVINDYNRKKLAKRGSQPQTQVHHESSSKSVVAERTPGSVTGSE